MNKPLQPRLIRPEKDGQVGEWSYLFEVNGEEFIFPALVGELGKLQPLVNVNKEAKPLPNHEEGSNPPLPEPERDPLWATKVIYWKASEWEQKYLPLAIEWTRRYGFRMPDVPFNVMELRKIEDRDGDERVTEIIHVMALRDYDEYGDTIGIHQYRGVDGEEGKGHRPLMQWWMEGFIDFKDGELAARGTWTVPNACERLADWGRFPVIVKDLIEEKGALHALTVISLHTDLDDGGIRDEELRAVTMWLAFCLYINSLKPTGEAIEPTGVTRRASGPKTLEEAVALEQATILKSAGILRSGVRRKTVATGTGTKHRCRYLVRGHERVINGKSIWIKPQIRGQGEFMVLPTATTPEVQAVIPETPVTVNVPVAQVEPEAAKPVLLLSTPKPRPVPRTALRRLLNLFRWLLRAQPG